MKRIQLPVDVEPTVPFYLSVEEWVAKHLPEGEYFFAWQVPTSVICGRHQEIDKEVDTEACNAAGVKIYRRKSGGGAVLADMNNVMFSYIGPASSVQDSFTSYTSRICSMLKSLGIDASPTGRNDIAINGKKVAGNAFLTLPGRSIVHGTMLYDTDFDLMSKLLTPSRAKLASKGVVSVPSRVTTLSSEGLKMSCHDFMSYALEYLCPESDGQYVLTDDDLSEISLIMRSYEFVNSHLDKFDSYCHEYIDGVGDLTLRYSLDDSNRLSKIAIYGDFMLLKDVQKLVIETLLGKALTRDVLTEAFHNIDFSEYIAGLDTAKFIDILTEKQYKNSMI